ncbi:MAG: endolytic transglycosylase MltG [Porphyromonas sp.]|nr:endolytic transglycosylase MltG [Porphyromonas sp.]
MKKRTRIVLWLLLGLLLVLGGGAYYAYHRWAKEPGFNLGEEQSAKWLYIYPDATWQAVVDSIEMRMDAPLAGDLRFLLEKRASEVVPPVGAYRIEYGLTTRAIYNRLVYGVQSPVQLTFNSARLPGTLWKRMSRHLLADSASIAEAMTDQKLLKELGVEDSTFAYRVLPNTYEVYWDITPRELMMRLEKEYQRFWNDERRVQAEVVGLTLDEVVNLAAIVQEESAKADEYPMIAGLYLNRLRIGMPLQADPTIKFALQDFGLRRILHRHLKVDSPYNTYLHAGLPPTPIRIPSISAIDGVLNAVDHNYIYMCARDDFSGYHAFAATYSEHMKNARKYARALDARNIK